MAKELVAGAASAFLGGVRLAVTGPPRYAMTARDAVELCRLVQPRTAIPIHYKGWGTSARGARRSSASSRAPAEIRRRVRWSPIGERVDLAA